MSRTVEDFKRAFEQGKEGIWGITLDTYHEGCPTCGWIARDCDTCGEEFVHTMTSVGYSPCDLCGDPRVGDRVAGHAFEDGHLRHLDVCADCAIYHLTGDLPDIEEE